MGTGQEDEVDQVLAVGEHLGDVIRAFAAEVHPPHGRRRAERMKRAIDAWRGVENP